MTPLRVDHTAIVVRDVDQAAERYRRVLGARPGERVSVPQQQVDVLFLAIGDTQIELIQPTTPDSGVARFLERRGESLHHVGLLVGDILAELRQLATNGVELIDQRPRRGAHGLVAFIHPRGTGGVLYELVQADTSDRA